MSNITQELLKELQIHQQTVQNIFRTLHEKAKEVWKWEKENLGVNSKYTDYNLKIDSTDCIEFCSSVSYGDSITFDEDYELNKEDYVVFTVYDRWPYGGYEEEELRIPLYKLLSDNWRDAAIEKYQKEQEAIQKEKERENKQKALEKEQKERAEYERLKAKYEQNTYLVHEQELMR